MLINNRRSSSCRLQLASEGLINAEVIGAQQADKRGRHQGFCFRKTKSGRFLPYICWKGGKFISELANSHFRTLNNSLTCAVFISQGL